MFAAMFRFIYSILNEDYIEHGAVTSETWVYVYVF